MVTTATARKTRGYAKNSSRPARRLPHRATAVAVFSILDIIALISWAYFVSRCNVPAKSACSTSRTSQPNDSEAHWTNDAQDTFPDLRAVG